ncbi:Rrf2 family transcriptional regulator [bacterium]|nr:Rrf2 family transcriptional regulator [bacterium]
MAAKAAAERLGVSPTYLAKILQSLAAKGLIASVRGIGGGFSLLSPASTLRCMDVLVALDGPLPEHYCLFERAVCATRQCGFKGLCDETAAKMRATLEGTTIADLARSFGCANAEAGSAKD